MTAPASPRRPEDCALFPDETVDEDGELIDPDTVPFGTPCSPGAASGLSCTPSTDPHHHAGAGFWSAQIFPVRANWMRFVFRSFEIGGDPCPVTSIDKDYREVAANRVYSRPFVVIGQIAAMANFFQLERTTAGDSVPSQGKLVFRLADLDACGILYGNPALRPPRGTRTIKKGDRLIQVANVEVDFNVIQAVPASPLGGNRTNTTARPIMLHVTVEQQRKKLGSL